MNRKRSIVVLMWIIAAMLFIYAGKQDSSDTTLFFIDSSGNLKPLDSITTDDCSAFVPLSSLSELQVSTESCVNVNSADADVLTTLPGIGPVLAERIIKFRVDEGAFRNPDDLIRVKGVGPAKLKKISDLICF